MTPMPARSGFVDLSRVPNAFMLQALSVSRARYFIASASGPTVLGWSFNVPTAIVDCSETSPGWGTAEKIVLTHEVTTPSGETLKNQALADSGLLDVRLLSQKIRDGASYTIRKNSAEELFSVADYLHARTGGTAGWRTPEPVSKPPRPNSIVWPPNNEWNVEFLDV